MSLFCSRRLRSLALQLSAFALLSVFASAARAQGIGAAQDFNVFVFGDLSRTYVDATGRVAAGGNATLQGYGVGSALANSNGTRDDLVIGGTLSYSQGTMFAGNVRSGGTATVSNVNYAQGNKYIAGNPVDFSAAQTSLTTLSSTIAAQAATGTTTVAYGGITLTGTNPSLNVFTLSATALGSANGLTINAPAGSTVHINVTGTSATMQNFQFFLNGVSKQRVLMNFPDATSLTIQGITPYASLLAPKAAVTFNNGGLDGQLIAKSLLPGNGEAHHFPFLGTLPPTPGAKIDLSLTKTVNTATPTVGDVITYTVTVFNDGQSAATGVVVTDVLPAGLQFVSATTSPSSSYTPGTGEWSVGTVPPSNSRTLTIQARVTSAGTIVNTAEVTDAKQTDVDSTPNNHIASEDDQASVPVTATAPAPPQVDLSLTKTVDTATAIVGDVITYTVTVANAGPDAATVVIVTDVLPAGLQFVSATPSAGSYTAGIGAWLVGGIASGTSKTLTIQARVTAAGTIVNTAEVTGASPSDVDSTPNNHVASEDDQASVTVTATAPPQVDVSLTKTVSAATATVGDVITYTVTVSNAGPDAATGVVVTDVLPAGLQFVSATPAAGTYTAATGAWSVGGIATGTSKTLTIQARVTAAGTIVNTAEVTGASPSDIDSTPDNHVAAEDDQASATVTATVPVPTPTIDLSLSKTVDQPAPTLGDVVTFTIIVRNTGAADATGVAVADVLPAGLQFVSATASSGTYTAATGQWAVGAVASGASKTLTIQARVTAAGAVENVAEVVAADQADVDSTPGNHLDSEDDQDAAAVTTGSPSGGGSAGVESEGTMATLMARRLYQRREDVAARAVLLAQPTPVLFADPAASGPRLSVSGAQGVSLKGVVPASGPLGTLAYDVTPADLLGVTNATSVVAADYVRPDGRRLAALFGATSPGGVLYDHAKATCDRFGGGHLDAVRRLDVDGKPFVLSRLVHADGAVDYAVSFVAYRQGTAYTVESQFAPEQYHAPAGTEEVVNLQVWSASEALTAELVQGVLARLASQGRVTHSATTGTVPRAFVVDGRYEAGALLLRLRNHTAGPLTVEVTGAVAATESDAAAGRRTAFTRTVTLPAPSAAAPLASVRVDVGPVFDGSVVVDPAVSHDQVYLADGTWSSYAPAGGATIQAMTTEAETRGAIDGTVLIERAASMRGEVRDYATLFRYLRPAGQPVDLRAYTHIEFEVRGTGAAQLLIEKASVDAWADKFVAPLALSSAWRTVRLPLASLVPAGGAAAGAAFTGEDVTMVAFYALGNRATSVPFTLDVRGLRFTTATTTDAAATDLADGAALAAPAPNPFGAAGTVLRYTVSRPMPVRVDVYDLLGRRVATLANEAMAFAGTHEVRLDGADLPSGSYIVRMTTPESSMTRSVVRLR